MYRGEVTTVKKLLLLKDAAQEAWEREALDKRISACVFKIKQKEAAKEWRQYKRAD